MDWIVSNLKLIAIISSALVLTSLLPELPRMFVKSCKWFWTLRGWRKWSLIGGILGMAATVAGVIDLVVSPPGGEQTVVEVTEPLPEDERPKTLNEALLTEWNADAQANWPVAAVMAEVSDLAYLSLNEAEPKFKAMGFESVEAMLDRSMVAYSTTSRL